MPGANLQLSPLEARKQLLLVESEVNRAQLSTECAAMSAQFHAWSGNFHSVISAAAAVVSGVRAMRGIWSNRPENNASWFSTLMNGVCSVASVWSALKSR